MPVLFQSHFGIRQDCKCPLPPLLVARLFRIDNQENTMEEPPWNFGFCYGMIVIAFLQVLHDYFSPVLLCNGTSLDSTIICSRVGLLAVAVSEFVLRPRTFISFYVGLFDSSGTKVAMLLTKCRGSFECFHCTVRMRFPMA